MLGLNLIHVNKMGLKDDEDSGPSLSGGVGLGSFYWHKPNSGSVWTIVVCALDLHITGQSH